MIVNKEVIIILNHLYKKKNNAFSFYEIIFSTFILILILNISFLKYQNFKETQSIIEAKTKINETFFYASLNSLKFHKNYSIKLDLISAKLILFDSNYTPIKYSKLPKNLNYFHTQSTAVNPTINFTKNGNISKSFSIYIFNKKNEVKYKISFYGFDRTRFLKINNYKKKKNSIIKLNQISEYHKNTNEDRDIFYIDWKKED